MKLWTINRAPAKRWTSLVIAGLLSAGAVLRVYSGDLPGAETHATRAGETQTFRLDDGSTVELNTRTRLEWFGGERRGRLAEGEAYFEVAPDAARPFRLELPEGDIQVLGTRLDVYRKSDGTVAVTVLDGAVLVEGHDRADHVSWHRELYANQQLVFRPNGVVHDTSTLSSASSVLSWRDGVIEFANVLLPEAVEELARYTDRRIVVQDRRLDALHVLGVVDTRDVRAVLRRLEKYAPVHVIEEGNTFVLRYREEQ